MRDPEEIVSLWQERKNAQDPWMQTAREVKAMYNGDVVIPLPELDDAEKPAVANLLQQGLDQTAMRIASTQANPFFQPLRLGSDSAKKAANERRRVILGIWEQNEMDIKDGRRARHLIGYSSAPVQLEPDFVRKIPRWIVRDPLVTFAAPTGDLDDMCPSDSIFYSQRSLGWLKRKYPDKVNMIARRRPTPDMPDNNSEMFDILEYVDAEEVVCVLVGKQTPGGINTGASAIDLTRYVNQAGICPVVVPGRITLDRQQGQFDGMLGMFLTQAKLQAGAVIATWRGIFKNEWFIARPGEVPRVITQADGRRGVYGQVQGADLHESSLDPSYMTNPMIDKLEAYQRMNGGVPAQMGGEAATNVRTGRASDSILAAAVDFRIQEAQKLMARSRKHEDKRAIAIDKAYWNRPKTVSFNGLEIQYTPAKLWVSDEHTVQYSYAGVDAQGITIEAAQLNGSGLLSKQTGREIHPMIKDPDVEHERLLSESLEQAGVAAIQQAAQQGSIPPADLARISELVESERMTWFAAVQQVQKEAQDRQATVDQQGNTTGAIPGSPETQPGLAQPGQGAEAGAAIQPPGASQQNLAGLLSSIRQSTRMPTGVSA